MQTRWMLVVLASLLIMGATATPATACSTVEPVPWFAETVTIDPQILPAGIEYRTTESRLPDHGLNIITIVNRSATPVCLLTQAYADDQDRAALPGVTLPEGTAPALKLVDGQTYAWNAAAKQWVVLNHADVTFSVWQNHVVLSNDQLVDLEPRNSYDEVRPTGVAIPNPQIITFDAVYGTRLFKLPITIQYTLNTAYREHVLVQDHLPAGCGGPVPTPTIVPVRQDAATQRANESLCIAVVFGLAVAACWIALWWRRYR